MKNHRYRVDVYAIKDGKILGTFTSSGIELPGGGIDAGESVEIAGKREMHEESGYDGQNFKEVFIPGEWICGLGSDIWLREQGYTHEVHKAVKCDLGEFIGGNKYNVEGDGSVYTLICPKQILEECLASINKGGLSERKLIIAQLRIAVIRNLFPNIVDGDPNIYLKW